MITLEEGSEDMLPRVQVKITTGRFWFQYWYEVCFWSEESGCWTHDYKKDGGGFGLWFVLRKANEALHDCWFEQLEIKNSKGTTQ